MEETKKIRIFVAVPTTGNVLDMQSYVLRELEQKYGDRVEFVWPKVCVRRMFHDFARNELIKEFLSTDADILWFLDSDIAPAKHVLELVTEHNDKWLVAGAPYPVFMTPAGFSEQEVLFCVYKLDDKDQLQPCKIPYQGTDWVDGLATGCLFIKREVFELVPEPYFSFQYDEKSRNPTHGEDIGFCRKMQSLGIKFFTDFSMVCEHYKTLGLLQLNNYAIRYANASVLAYDAQIKAQVAEAVKAAYLQGKKDAEAKPKSSLILPDSFR